MFKILITYLLLVVACSASNFDLLSSVKPSAKMRNVLNETYQWSESQSNETWFTGWELRDGIGFTNQWTFFATNEPPIVSTTNFDCKAIDDSSLTNAIKFDGKMELEERGRISYACEFDGFDDWVDCGNDDSLNLTPQVDAFSLCCWFVAESVGTLVSKAGAELISRQYQVYVHVTHVIKTVIGGAVSASSSAINFGELVFAVVTVPSSTSGQKIYINGYNDGLSVDGGIGTVTNVSQNVNIGGRTDGGYLFNGQISSAQIYSRVLSASEVLDLYEGRDVDKTSLVLDCQSAPSDSKFHSQRTPMPSNGFRDTASNTNLVNSGTGELGIEVVE